MDALEQTTRSGRESGRRRVDGQGAGGGGGRGADIGAILSALPLMWVALGESSDLLQVLLVALGVAAFATTRLRPPLPPLPRMRR